MGLTDLPSDLMAATLRFVDYTSLLHLELVSRRVRKTIVLCDSWRILAQNVALYAKNYSTRRSADWKRLAVLTYQPVSEELSMLRQVRECSSVDHPNESADNTLTRSHCGIGVALLSNTVVADDPLAFEAIAKRLQLECGCARGLPCYWSSASTWGHSTIDHLHYTLQENCLVHSVKIVPYRVFWYPGSPTYSPKRVSFALYELADNGAIDTLVYESMTFSIVKEMKMQTFELPCRVFLSRGVLQLNLYDRQEDIGVDVARWMQENHLPPYYTCLSYVGVTGLLESGTLV